MSPFVVVTGLSGAGKSLLLRALEDLGYETIDNLPLSLLQAATEESRPSARPLAIGIDVRSRHFSATDVLAQHERLQRHGTPLTLIFLESDDTVLQRRYRETRRAHPLSEGTGLPESISQERLLLEPIKGVADLVIDTSLFTPPEFKGFVRNRFGFEAQRTLGIHLMSFAFREGIPREADMLFDMRFLRNPFYEPELKPLTGRTGSVQSYIEADTVFQDFGGTLKQMLDIVLPPIEVEGRSHFVIAFGCSGGRHRSVFATEWVGTWLQERGYKVEIYHRELRRSTI